MICVCLSASTAAVAFVFFSPNKFFVSLPNTLNTFFSQQFAEAIADFTAVIKEDPSNANAYFNRGATHDSVGAYDKAVADYSRALEIDQNK